MADTPIYVYCVIRSAEPRQFTTTGMGGRGDAVRTVHHRELAAVISDSPEREYESSRRNMMAHSAVLEETMRSFALLPMRFGTVAPSLLAVTQQMLERRYDELDDLLRKIENRVELGLKVFWREEGAFHEIIAESPQIRQLRDKIAGRSLDESYYERIRLGELVEAAMQQKRAADSEAVVGRLRPLARETIIGTTATDRMVVNAAFLVDRSNEPAFDAEVAALDQEHGQRLIFKYVGSVPPYNFVNVVMRWT